MKIKAAIENFLDLGGNELGYDDRNLPKLEDFEVVLSRGIAVWEYNGCKTPEEYYGGPEDE